MSGVTGRALVSQLLSKYRLLVIEKSSCAFCHRAKTLLNKYDALECADVAHVLDIENRKDVAEIQEYLMSVSRISTVPQVFVGGRFIGGATDLENLHMTGKLKRILQENDILK